MDKAIFLLFLFIILMIALTNIEQFSGQVEGPLDYGPARYRMNYTDQFDKAVISDDNRIAVLKNKLQLDKCTTTECPPVLKDMGFDCFKCKI